MGTTDLPELEDVVTGLFATDQGPCLEIAHKTVLLVDPDRADLRGIRGSIQDPPA